MIHNLPVTQQHVVSHNDQIYRETKWLAVFIIPFLIVAFVLLFFWPNQTDKTFAWTILPSMTPMMLLSLALQNGSAGAMSC